MKKRSGTARDLPCRLGARVRQLRKTLKLTQTELAEKARVSWKYIGEVENARRDLRVSTLLRIAKALNVEVVDLFRFSVADQTLLQIEEMLKGQDEAFRGRLVQLVRDALLLVESAR